MIKISNPEEEVKHDDLDKEATHEDLNQTPTGGFLEDIPQEPVVEAPSHPIEEVTRSPLIDDQKMSHPDRSIEEFKASVPSIG